MAEKAEKAKVMIVDDEAEVCELVKHYLTLRHYTVFTASNNKEALEVFDEEHPEIILLDIRMGKDSGLTTLRKIKELDGDVKVIMLTALDDEPTIKEARRLGADDYITKPLTMGYMEKIIVQKVAEFSSRKKT